MNATALYVVVCQIRLKGLWSPCIEWLTEG